SEEVTAAVARAHEALGTIDLVCNVAGGAGLGMGMAPLLQIEEREWDRVIDVNLKGTWLVSRACAERMLAAGRPGRIVNGSARAPGRPRRRGGHPCPPWAARRPAKPPARRST